MGQTLFSIENHHLSGIAKFNATYKTSEGSGTIIFGQMHHTYEAMPRIMTNQQVVKYLLSYIISD